MTVLDVRGLRFRYPGREVEVLGRVDLRADLGEFVLILGRNGSGKSTLLKLIAGLLEPLEGEIRVQGTEIRDLTSSDRVRSIGFMGENGAAGILGGTVAEEVAFPLENLGVPRTEMVARVEEVLERLGIVGLRERDVSELSAGERQIVSLAVMLSADPPVLLLDEPVVFLDESHRGAFWRGIETLTRQGTTVLAASCRPSDGARPDRILLLREGRLVPLESDAEMTETDGLDETNVETDFLLEPTRSSGSPMFELNSVDFSFRGGSPVLKSVHWAIPPDESVLLDGPMGSGKTALCRLLLGLEKPTGGTVRFCGLPIECARSEIGRRVGYVAQSPELSFYTPSVAEEVDFGPDFLKGDVGSIRGPLLRTLNLEGSASRHPLTLSRGERKRLALACALAKGPDFLVLDDLFAGLDPVESRRISSLLRGIQSTDRGFLLTGEETDGLRSRAEHRGRIRDGRVTVD